MYDRVIFSFIHMLHLMISRFIFRGVSIIISVSVGLHHAIRVQVPLGRNGLGLASGG